jgi:hypothetical protein
MPVKEYTIIIVGGTWNGYKLIKYSEREAQQWIDCIEEYYGAKCELIVRDLV